MNDTPTLEMGQYWRHKKTGHEYIIEGFCVIEASMAPAVLYRQHKGGEAYSATLWARPVTEFMDGRFELLSLSEGRPTR